MSVKIQQQNRRSMVIKATPGGAVAYIPRWLKPTSPEVRAFIEEGLKKLRGQRIQPLPPPQTTPDEIRAMVREWGARLGVQPKRVTLRLMNRKWGSCSSRENIQLNSALCHIARPLAEYVVCHELAHLRVFNHGKAFKALMNQYMPDWRDREAALKRLVFI